MYLYKTVGDRMENIFITNFEKRSIQTLMATQHNHSNGLEHVIVSRKMVTVLASQLEMSRQEWNGYCTYVPSQREAMGWDQDGEPFPCLCLCLCLCVPCPHRGRPRPWIEWLTSWRLSRCRTSRAKIPDRPRPTPGPITPWPLVSIRKNVPESGPASHASSLRPACIRW